MKKNTKRADQGLRALRERLDEAAIPPSKRGRSLAVASWNIRRFGRKLRRPESIGLIAEIVRRFDLVAIKELRAGVIELEVLLEARGSRWSAWHYGEWRNKQLPWC